MYKKYDFVNTSKGDQAIIDGSYGDLYGGNDHEDYAIYIVRDGKIAFRTSWVSKDELELSNLQLAQFAETLVTEYENK